MKTTLDFISAEYARELSKSREEKIEVMRKIKETAIYTGEYSLKLTNCRLTAETISFLCDAGYSVTDYTSTNRTQYILISWEA